MCRLLTGGVPGGVCPLRCPFRLVRNAEANERDIIPLWLTAAMRVKTPLKVLLLQRKRLGSHFLKRLFQSWRPVTLSLGIVLVGKTIRTQIQHRAGRQVETVLGEKTLPLAAPDAAPVAAYLAQKPMLDDVQRTPGPGKGHDAIWFKPAQRHVHAIALHILTRVMTQCRTDAGIQRVENVRRRLDAPFDDNLVE